MVLGHTGWLGKPEENIVNDTTAQRKALVAYVRKANRWFTYVGSIGTAQELARPAMPTKAAKHRAYADANHILRAEGREAERPQTFIDLCRIAGVPCNDYILAQYAK